MESNGKLMTLYQLIKVQVCDGEPPKHYFRDAVGSISDAGVDINRAHKELQDVNDNWSKVCGVCRYAVQEKQ